MPPPPSQPPSTPSPHQILASGIIANSIPEVRRGIDLVSQTRRGFEPDKALKQAIMHCQPEIVRYLLDQAGATVEGLQPWYVYYATNWKGNGEEVRDENDGEMERVEKTWELLLKEGWDVNSREKRGEGRDDGTTIYNPAESLLSFAVPWPRLVRWCLAHGASVLEPPDLNPLWTRPLLEEAAIYTSLETFKLLRQHGAKLTTRVLHRAVESAAYASGDKIEERIAFVRYLIEEEGCNVNALDVEEGNQFPNHWGTPMAYAAHVSHGGEEGDGREVVRYLLEKGADPTIKDCWNANNVLDSAQMGFAGKAVIEVLEEWKRRQEKDPNEQ